MTTTGKKRSYPRFLGAEVGMAAAAFFLAFFVAQYLNGWAPWLFQGIANLVPAPIYPTGFAVAYSVTAGLIFLGTNSFLWFTGLRKL